MKNYESWIKYPYNTPEVPEKDVKILWESNRWDGPLNGMCLYKDKKMWFECAGEDDDRYRRYILIELTPDELAEEEKWHNLFREKVGTHCDYNESGRRNDPETHLKRGNTWREFYDEYNKVKDEMGQYHLRREPYAFFEEGRKL